LLLLSPSAHPPSTIIAVAIITVIVVIIIIPSPSSSPSPSLLLFRAPFDCSVAAVVVIFVVVACAAVVVVAMVRGDDVHCQTASSLHITLNRRATSSSM
jgi:hypothetical protein